jgi:non-homologous end joining protein Ku
MAYRPGVILQFGMVTVIVDIDNAVASETSLKNVCLGHPGELDALGVDRGHAPTAVKQRPLMCPDCGNDDPTTMKKANVVGKQFIVVEKTEVADAKASSIGASAKFISLLAHPAEEVHSQSIQGKGVYQLKPSTQEMGKVVSLLLDVVQRHPELAFTCLWAPAGRQNFYEVRAFGDTLVMEERCRTEQLKIIQQPKLVVLAAHQARMDENLLTDVVPYSPATYQDAYLAKLEEVLASKTAQDGVLAPKTKSIPMVAGSVDLSAMLGLGPQGLVA